MSGIYTFLGYIKKLLFVDGQVLHAHHLNKMQDSIAGAVKEKITIEKYDSILDFSKYKCYFLETFINTNFKSYLSSCTIDEEYIRLVDGEWVTPLLELPTSDLANEILILSSTEIPEGAFVKFYFRNNLTDTFEEINEKKTFTTPKDKIQIKVKAISSATKDAYVNDFALFWK